MTPKEKAEELINKFLIQTENYTYCGLYRTVAKKCALIAVDEIMEEIKKWNMSVIDYGNRIQYWQDVKQEIEKL